jgi:hypothetical protein
LFGKSNPDAVKLHPRYMYDPLLVPTHNGVKGYVTKVWIGGEEYRSDPVNLTPGVNLIPIKTEKLTRYVLIGSPPQRTYKQGAGKE